ncbi:putative ABC transport system ATP-binding protein [Thermoanaerobacter thermohydrosulfuricus]|uniref:ABC-type antimicrobial peptide transport system, ATPase component n=3 Tax=Thermoanaerobacter TaxID=1754 RepID=I8R1V3_9THEO|nr:MULTISPECIES: ABC transporter ATP-binding protein [Thermoanaerobacter]EGD53159.1 ABC transporter related protein [Thermoanaerobacter ethanolicus JW 200]AEM77756.1 ABC transporter related protein [Thermoanaerobacter wiegelii Rt8.B1]EIV99359.1 ABC-type antimicrobial peptide transport system, ATPase component [Thermoanaerobacter siderophilus SR4]UZQ84271.1 ABC transporter ATP-binding protein [Thermoanaerobacter sp. RKWS2]SDG53840.1 putative ABC transport system ATP-binding protein [Thermoanaer
MDNILIKIRNLTKIYKMGENEVRALDGINLDIEKGEFVSIVGQSGSGKTTLMNIIGCLDVKTSGEYFLNGIDTSKLSDNQLADLRCSEIGFVFQNFNLLQKMTALENVELPMIYKGVPTKERRQRAEMLLEMVGLKERMHHRPNELSGGQQQRVAIARALANNPHLILADEPTGNLDSKSGSEIMKIIKELNERGNTVVLITHDPNIAAQAKRIVRIKDGRILENEVVTP